MCTVYTAASKQRGIHIQVEIEGKGVEMLLDTGAQATLMSETVYKVTFSPTLTEMPLEIIHFHQ